MKNNDRTAKRKEKTAKRKKAERVFTVVAFALIAVVLIASAIILTVALLQKNDEPETQNDNELIVGSWYSEIDGVKTCWKFESDGTAIRYRKNDAGSYEETERLPYLLNTELKRMIFVSDGKQSVPFDYTVSPAKLIIGYNGTSIVFSRGYDPS